MTTKNVTAGMLSNRLRHQAQSLIDLADDIDRHRSDEGRTSIFNRWTPSQNEQEDLAELARHYYNVRTLRERYLPEELLGEPLWDMLLDLFICHVERRKISVTSACLASRAPPTSALRYVKLLEEVGLVEREASSSDRRSAHLHLSTEGVQCMENLMRDLEGLDARRLRRSV